MRFIVLFVVCIDNCNSLLPNSWQTNIYLRSRPFAFPESNTVPLSNLLISNRWLCSLRESRTTVHDNEDKTLSKDANRKLKQGERNGVGGFVGSEDELEKFRNRAALVEAVLKGKVEELKGLQARVKELEDSVEKLKAEAKETKNTKDQYEAVLEERDEARKSLELLQRDWDEAAQSMTRERRTYSADREKMERDLNAQIESAAKERGAHKEAQTRLKKQIEDMDKDVIALENAMESMEQDVEKLVSELRREQDQREEERAWEEQEIARVNDELVKVRGERDRALDEARGSTEGEGEAIQIAKAAAAAAERREASIRAKYEDLLSQSERQPGKSHVLPPEENNLQREIEELNEQIQSLKMTHGAALRAKQRESDKRVAEVTGKYHKELQRARKELLTGRQEEAAPRQRSGGMWKRIRRPFRKESEE